MTLTNLTNPDTAAAHRKILRVLFEDAEAETFQRGEPIFSTASAHPFVYLLVEGMVKLSSIRQDKFHLEDFFLQGELINCQSVFDWPVPEQLAEAMANATTVKRIPSGHFHEALQVMPGLMELFSQSLARSLARAQERLYRVSSMTTQQRVVHHLHCLVQTAGRRVGYEYLLRPTLTHRDFGALAGVSRQTVSTVFNELRREGIIHFTRKYLIVRDLDRLKQMVNLIQV